MLPLIGLILFVAAICALLFFMFKHLDSYEPMAIIDLWRNQVGPERHMAASDYLRLLNSQETAHD